MPRSALPSLLAIPLLVSACDKNDAPAQTPEPSTAAADATAQKPDFSQDECKDWSALDLETLPTLPASEYTATFEVAWSTLLSKHYDPTLGCKDWVAVREWYGDKIAQAPDSGKAYALMNGMLGELEQSHIAIVPPGSRTQGETRSGTIAGPAIVPAAVRYIDGKTIVVDGKRHGLDSGIPAGAEIIAVDDAKVADVVQRASKVAHDPINEALTIRRVVGTWLTCPSGASKTIRYIPEGSAEETTTTVKCEEPDLETTTFGNLTQPTTVDTHMIEGTKIGYVSFNIWLVPLMPKIEAGLSALRKKGMKSLIIDLRGNPGGVGFMVVPLARQLLTEDVNLGIMHMREGQQEFNVTGSADAFQGEVVVLIDELSASTSEIFAQSMQDIGRIKVFGATRSPGLALPSLIEELPGGAMLQYVVADYQSPKGASVEGNGVKPDTVVPETAADFAAGKDPVLDAAVAALNSKG
ncbi:MAG: S41 family peptidase [Nannocystaceae bacterium]|nr:S41 family peptidase [bacterium]